MLPEIKTITLALPYRLGSVNCYLVKTDAGYILIDTGSSNKRAESLLQSLTAHPFPGYGSNTQMRRCHVQDTTCAAHWQQRLNLTTVCYRSIQSQRKANVRHTELVEPNRDLFGGVRLVIFQPPYNRTHSGVQNVAHAHINRWHAGIALRDSAGQHVAETFFDVLSETLRTECRIPFLAQHHPSVG